ncbi:MAG: hypothetical protein CNLJKLNK_01275 [Holosporales bacterium]
MKTMIFLMILITAAFSSGKVPSVSSVKEMGIEGGSLCKGKFPNPVTDICWEGMFPIRIGGFEHGSKEGDGSKSPIMCTCPKPPFNQPTPGIRVSFFEPTRMMDVTRTPFCFVNLGGLKIGNSETLNGRGTVDIQSETMTKASFWHVHFYFYPVLFLFELLVEFICMDKGVFDISYITEFDPLWNNDLRALIQNPEAVLFGNILAQGSCLIDCQSTMNRFPIDHLFWCAGCHGCIYPFTGKIPSHITSVQATELAAIKFMAMQHRRGLLHSYLGDNPCGASPCFIIKKSMYKLQMVSPVPSTRNAVPLGRSDFLYGRHYQKEVIQKSSHYGYLLFRRRECCLL